MLGIIGAVNEEAEVIKGEMKNLVEEKVGDIQFFKGELYGKEAVFAQSGIGKVNGAVTAALMIHMYSPDSIIFSGVAGSLDGKIKIGDIVVGTDVLQHDFDTTEFGYERGEIPGIGTRFFKSDLELLKKAEKIENGIYTLHFGRILTGDSFVSGKEKKEQLGREFEALCVDMESGAVAQVCHKFKVKFMIIRSISDSLSDNSEMEYYKFVKLAAENSKEILKQILAQII